MFGCRWFLFIDLRAFRKWSKTECILDTFDLVNDWLAAFLFWWTPGRGTAAVLTGILINKQWDGRVFFSNCIINYVYTYWNHLQLWVAPTSYEPVRAGLILAVDLWCFSKPLRNRHVVTSKGHQQNPQLLNVDEVRQQPLPCGLLNSFQSDFAVRQLHKVGFCSSLLLLSQLSRLPLVFLNAVCSCTFISLRAVCPSRVAGFDALGELLKPTMPTHTAPPPLPPPHMAIHPGGKLLANDLDSSLANLVGSQCLNTWTSSSISFHEWSAKQDFADGTFKRVNWWLQWKLCRLNTACI